MAIRGIMNSIKQQWDWWRHNHEYSRLRSLKLTAYMAVIMPVQNVYTWFWLQTMGRYYHYEIRKIEKELKRS